MGVLQDMCVLYMQHVNYPYVESCNIPTMVSVNSYLIPYSRKCLRGIKFCGLRF